MSERAGVSKEIAIATPAGMAVGRKLRMAIPERRTRPRADAATQ